MIRKLAKISSANLEIKERGILNFWIYVDYEDGLSQGIGGIALDTYDEEKKKRVGTAYGCEMIRRLLETLSVNDFSEMKNQIIWVHCDGDNFASKAIGIEPLNVNKSKQKAFIFEDVYDEFKDLKF